MWLLNVQFSPRVLQDDPFYSMVRYMVQCANCFFRILRRNGVFLEGNERVMALHYGLEMNASQQISGLCRVKHA